MQLLGWWPPGRRGPTDCFSQDQKIITRINRVLKREKLTDLVDRENGIACDQETIAKQQLQGSMPHHKDSDVQDLSIENNHIYLLGAIIFKQIFCQPGFCCK